LPAGSGDIATKPPSVPSETAPAPAEPAKPAEPAAPAAAPAETAPAPAEPAKPAEATESSHVIVAGDTYWDLAVKAYGDGTKWKLISGANKGYEPHHLPIGTTLIIPTAGK
jgi:5'-nucleotidase